ncbi:MAG: type 4a pilus biogenesis protein PilO [Nitrospirota bacterium]
MDKIQRIPSRTRVIVFLALVGVLVVLYIWQVHIPKNTEIKRLEGEVAGLQARIRENDEKIKKLDELKAEVKALHERLKLLTEQLPPGSEVSGLLRQIQNLVNQSGLSLKLWRPDKRRVHPSGLYEEIPIIMELTGGYHNVAMFFDRVSRMTRIVNMLNVRMTGARVVKGGVVDTNISCTAMTFAAVEKKPDAAPAAKKVQ